MQNIFSLLFQSKFFRIFCFTIIWQSLKLRALESPIENTSLMRCSTFLITLWAVITNIDSKNYHCIFKGLVFLFRGILKWRHSYSEEDSRGALCFCDIRYGWVKDGGQRSQICMTSSVNDSISKNQNICLYTWCLGENGFQISITLQINSTKT